MAIVRCANCGTLRESYLQYCRACGDRSEGEPISDRPGSAITTRPGVSRDWQPSSPSVDTRAEPGLLWRSIVQGFGWAIGFTLFGVMFWLLVLVLFGGLFHASTPSLQGFGGIPIPTP